MLLLRFALSQTTTVSTVGELEEELLAAGTTRIILAAGHYLLTEELVISRAVVLEAELPGMAVLDGQGLTRVLRVAPPSGSDSVSIIGVNVTGGLTNRTGVGGGILITSGEVVLTSLAVYWNRVLSGADYKSTATYFGEGGGIAVEGGHVTIFDADIHSNLARHGGGLCLLGGQVMVQGGRIHGNRAVNSDCEDTAGISNLAPPLGDLKLGAAARDTSLSRNASSNGFG